MAKDTILKLAADFPPATRKAWRALAEKTLKGEDFEERLVSHSDDGIALMPLYTPEDWSASNDPSGFPGFAPFTRGGHAAPRPRRGAWDIRARYEGPDAEATNRAILNDLEQGVTSIELCAGSGRVPVDEITRALEGVRPGTTAVALDAGADFAAAAQALISFWSGSRTDAGNISGALNADPLGTLARDGTLHEKLDRSFALMATLAQQAAAFPRVTAIGIDTRPYHNAGATEAQELGIMLATGVAYLRVLNEGAGLSVDDALDAVGTTLTADTDIFLTVAKLRAARMLWARMATACGPGEDARAIRLQVQTSERMAARFDPWVNLLRMTAATFGAAVGGADGITVLPHTQALGLPDDFARRLSRNTQIVLMEESNLGAVMDPAGGSHAFECLTEDLARAGWTFFQEIEAEGGMAAALRSGLIRREIDAVWEERAARLARRDDTLVGVSIYPQLGETKAKIAGAHPRPRPLAPGERLEPLPRRRLADVFEQLREAANAYAARHGERPKVGLLTIGTLADYNERAQFARDFFAVAGIETAEPGEPGAAIDDFDAGLAIADMDTDVFAICSSDGVYEAAYTNVEGIAHAVRPHAKRLLLVGDPGRHRSEWTKAGIDAFIHRGCDAVEELRATLKVLGIEERAV